MRYEEIKELPFSELDKMAQYAADMAELKGMTLSDMLDIRPMDRNLRLGIVMFWVQFQDMTVDQLNKFSGMNGRIGTEA